MGERKVTIMDETIKAYLDHAKEVIGERTEGQILYDDAVVEV